jgi:magnesium transporter
MSRYEAALGARVEIAFFVPGIVYLADAIGTQSEAVAVRGLSVAHQPLGRLLLGELGTGALIGLVLAALIFPAVLLIFGDSRLAAAVSLAVLFSGTAAAFMGLLLPWTLSRLGRDPAFGSGPVATVLQDVLSLLVYLVTCTLLLR